MPDEAGLIALFKEDLLVSGEAPVAGFEMSNIASGRLRLVLRSVFWHLRAGILGTGGFLVFLGLRRTVRQSGSREEDEREVCLVSLSESV